MRMSFNNILKCVYFLPCAMLYACCDFVDNGAVAQLGERQNRTLEVGGSTPLCSTKKKGG
jgi:hypothetical protein